MKKPFYKDSLHRLDIIKQQADLEGPMTLRRIYYVLVGKSLIKPGENGYNSIRKLCKKARELGYLPWGLIVDRARRIEKRSTFDSFDEMFVAACKQYRRNTMLEQDNYVEVWIEKDAVSENVLKVTYGLDVPLVVGRGFSSLTFIHDASRRVLAQKQKGIKMVILYISDFDPEGEHIPELVKRKFMQYGCPPDSFNIEKIALTPEQVEQFQLPSNIEFKVKSKHRQKEYVQRFLEQYGEVQYELDALSVLDLNRILTSGLEKVVDFEIPKKSDQASREEVETWVEEHYQE